jgi:hypothetical protein
MRPPPLATNDPVLEEQLPAAPGYTPVIAAQRPIPVHSSGEPAEVGSSGNAGLRIGVATAYALIVPPRICGTAFVPTSHI